MVQPSTSRCPLLIGLAIGVAAILGFVAFGVFGVHLLFFDDEVAEAAPTFTATTATTESLPTESADPEGDDGTPTTVAPPPVVPTIAATGNFVDGDHPTSGTVNVLTDGGVQRVLRLEDDFATDNGPDLDVYLASSADVGDDAISLGDLKGNIGSQNYDIPADVDLELYDTVVIWCVRFGVAFGSSELVLG